MVYQGLAVVEEKPLRQKPFSELQRKHQDAMEMKNELQGEWDSNRNVCM